ncbi:hypothetical protein NUW54_g3363 [Trametes sanguinea]|uniref:Uncharacterized protein n=1 Tax=Trametes sanguinea TaxID=158606 RepID=A0ACC1Q0Y8_9APHY|nr:hypothetical protein NUW54_g3363 [Trametes sanguinea]
MDDAVSFRAVQYSSVQERDRQLTDWYDSLPTELDLDEFRIARSLASPSRPCVVSVCRAWSSALREDPQRALAAGGADGARREREEGAVGNVPCPERRESTRRRLVRDSC